MPPSSNQQSNPYAQAAGAYGSNAQNHTPDQRELEGRILLKSAKMLTDLQNDWDSITPELLQETLRYNRQIWMMFFDTAIENPEENGETRPNDLRSNIVNLANFIFKREMEILAQPEKQKIDILVNINREVAAGLMSKPKDSNKGNAEATS